MGVEVIGVDWSLAATGVCDAMGVRRTLTPPTRDRVDRLVWFFRQAQALVADLDLLATVLVFEQPYVAGPERGSSTLDLGRLYGVLDVALRHWQHRIAWVPVGTLKVFATGSGKSKKPDLRAEAIKRGGVDIADDNQCDAWWLRLMGLYQYGAPAFDLPASHVRALHSVKWPGWS